MALNLLHAQAPEVSFLHEVSFQYKNEVYKVHVTVLKEEQDTIYKLYFKNNIEDTDKSLMKIFKKADAGNEPKWICRPDYFCYKNDEIAEIAGGAIERVLQEKG